MASGTLEMFSLFVDESQFSLYRADGRQRVWHHVGEQVAMTTMWMEWPMVEVGLWYGQAYVMDSEHRYIF